MPWLDKVGAVVEAWYPGQRGGEAIAECAVRRGQSIGPAADHLSGERRATAAARSAGPRHRLEHDLHRRLPRRRRCRLQMVRRSSNLTPLFPFGFGLSYTRFRYSDLRISGGQNVIASFTVTNIGKRAGADVPQLYAARAPRRMAARCGASSAGANSPRAGREPTVRCHRGPAPAGAFRRDTEWLAYRGRRLSHRARRFFARSAARRDNPARRPDIAALKPSKRRRPAPPVRGARARHVDMAWAGPEIRSPRARSTCRNRHSPRLEAL